MCADVYRYLGLADFSHVDLAADAAGSKDLGETDTLAVLGAAQAIRQRGLTVVDIVAALDECGYPEYAERALAFVRARLAGDYLQTSAIFDEQLSVLSLVTDPNDYAGPARATPRRQRGRPRSTRSARCAAWRTCAGPSPRWPSPACSARPGRPAPGLARATW